MQYLHWFNPRMEQSYCTLNIAETVKTCIDIAAPDSSADNPNHLCDGPFQACSSDNRLLAEGKADSMDSDGIHHFFQQSATMF